MNLSKAVNLDDVRKAARRRLPKVLFDYIEGGCDAEECLAHNESAFSRYRFVPRYCVDVTKCSSSVQVLGKTYASPIGIAPSGITGLFRRNAELMFAEAAAAKNIPYAMACMSTATLEAAARIAPDNLWLQIYGTNDRAYMHDFVKRARDVGIKTLVLTIDSPLHAKRERNLRNGMDGLQNRMPLSIKLEALRHPGWIWEYLRHGGTPVFSNYTGYAQSERVDKVNAFIGTQHLSRDQTWRDLEKLRDVWTGQIVVKGILHPADATRAVALGADGLYVSNHGGRQLDRAPASIEMLPLIRAAVGDTVTLMIDSGIRRGSDVILARCLGADLAFLGRPPIYAVAAGGRNGVDRMIDILQTEILGVLAQIGCSEFASLDQDLLFDTVTQRFMADDTSFGSSGQS